MADEVTTTLLEEIIPTEDIDRFIASFEYAPPVGQIVAWTRPSPLGSIAVRFPRWNQLGGGAGIPAGTKTEAAAFTRDDIDTTESSITPGLVGVEMAITDEAMRGAVSGVPAGVLMEAVNAMNDRIDSDVLSSSTAATNTTGTTGDNFTAANLHSAIAAYRVLNVHSVPAALVLHNDAVRDLMADLGSTAAPFGAQTVNLSLFGPNSGFHGQYLGFNVFESSNVAAEAPGWSNFITPMGQMGGLGLAMTESPRIVTNRTEEGERDAETVSVIRAWYGTGLTNPRRFLEVLSRT